MATRYWHVALAGHPVPPIKSSAASTLMQLEERVVGDVVVLAPSGRLTRNENFGAVKDRLQALVQEGRKKLVLNLAAVSYMDSTCVGELVSGLVTVRNNGGALYLASPTSRVERLLTVARLTSVFQICQSEQEAVLSLAGLPREN